MRDEPRKRRRKPRPLRFLGVKLDDILIQQRKVIEAYRRPRPFQIANDDPQEVEYVPAISTYYAIVTDLWFDPVFGQTEESAGRMVGLRYWAGEPIGSKWSHNLLGLARAGWQYATPDQIGDLELTLAQARRRREALRAGEVTPIKTVR